MFIALTKLIGMVIILGFFWLIFDMFIMEPFFDCSLVYDSMPSPLYTLISYIMVFGVPIAIFLRGIQEAMEA